MVAAVLTTAALIALTPQQKAALVVVSGLPAPPGVGGVIVQRYDRDAPRPPGALVFSDQEGGDVRAFRDLPPATVITRVSRAPDGSLHVTGTTSSNTTLAAVRVNGHPARPLGSDLSEWEVVLEGDIPFVQLVAGAVDAAGLAEATPHKRAVEPDPDPDRHLDRLEHEPVGEAGPVGDAVLNQWEGHCCLQKTDVARPEREDRGDVHQHENEACGRQRHVDVEALHRRVDGEKLAKPAQALEEDRAGGGQDSRRAEL